MITDMIYDPWFLLAASAAFFVSLEIFLSAQRSQQLRSAQIFLKRAKQEAQEIAQLPLKNPHPQIQISETGKFLFANPAALKKFPNIAKMGFQHPVLANVRNVRECEVAYEDKIYHQTIAQTSVNAQKAYVIYCYDITQRKIYEKEIQAAHKRAEAMRQTAEEAKEARGEFLANMSHELRTPMNGIIGLSDLLVEMDLGGEKQGLIEAVNSSARNLLILLNDILDFSKIEAGELTIESIPFDLRKTVDLIDILQRPMASQKGLTMTFEIEDEVPQYLVGDPARLQQILNNLISNALKFTEEGSVRLKISGHRKAGGVFLIKIEVIDTGIGIPQEKQAAIFEKFQQADASTARRYGGTGLGLAITRDLTALMNGKIELKSMEGAGTAFTVTLPMPVAQRGEEGAYEKHVQKKSLKINTEAKIMVVDDHPVNLLFMRQVLKKAGFTDFDEAQSGKQALACFSERDYDVIIMDCQMPEMDGFEAARKIREIQTEETAPVIIAATADAMKGAEERCMQAGMDDYISKPIDKDKLYSLLARWIPAEGKESGRESEDNQSSVANNAARNTVQASKNVIDLGHLHEFTDGDKEAEKEIIGIFSDHLRSDMAALQKSFDEKKYEEWDSWVHKIYGACSHIGAHALAGICDKGQSLTEEETDQIPEIHAIILREYQKVQAFFRSRAA